jgi:hypothetical protein
VHYSPQHSIATKEGKESTKTSLFFAFFVLRSVSVIVGLPDATVKESRETVWLARMTQTTRVLTAIDHHRTPRLSISGTPSLMMQQLEFAQLRASLTGNVERRDILAPGWLRGSGRLAGRVGRACERRQSSRPVSFSHGSRGNQGRRFAVHRLWHRKVRAAP